MPCTLSVATLVAVSVTAPPAAPPAPSAPGTCPASLSCTATLPPFTATCPPGYTPDGAAPMVCDSPTPTPTPTATPTPTPTVLATPSAVVDTPTPAASGNPAYPWTAVLKTGAHPAGPADLAYWLEVDIDHDGVEVAQACFGGSSGAVVNWSGIHMSPSTTSSNLTALDVPRAFADLTLENCGAYHFGESNPLAGSF